MLITCSLSEAKKFEADYKYFIVINPKKVKLKGIQHRPDLAPSQELYDWAMEHKNEKNWFDHYKEVFTNDMKTRKGLVMALDEIEKKAKEKDVLLICFCSDVNFCHRGLIADEMMNRGVNVNKY